MPRPLYGYRVVSGHIAIDPLPATVVAAVLAMKKRKRYGAACLCVRQLLPDLSDAAIYRLVHRIRSHAHRYAIGQPTLVSSPSGNLRLTAQPVVSSRPSPVGSVERSRRHRS